MVSADRYEGTRTAQLPDWIHIKDILAPLAEEGVLVKKNDDDLKREVSLGNFSVTERDGKIIACAALRRYELRTRGKLAQRFTTSVETGDENLLTDSRKETVEIVAEIGAFAVKPGYRNEGRGDALLSYLEKTATERYGLGPFTESRPLRLPVLVLRRDVLPLP